MSDAAANAEELDDTSGGGGTILSFIAVIVALMVLAVLFMGCAYKGGKVVEGTDLSIGINMPLTDGVLQLQVLNYLSGFRLGVDRNANLTLRYTVAETNDYFGVVHTRATKTVEASVEPVAETCGTNAAPDRAECEIRDEMQQEKQ